jgi:hypothetical protein
MLISFAALCAPAYAGTTTDIVQASEIRFYGIDYSRVQMIGSDDFAKPEEIFPKYLDTWNTLVASEQLDDLESNLGNKQIVSDFDVIIEVNKTATADQVVRTIGLPKHLEPSLSSTDLEQMIKGYPLTDTDGVGLVFVGDALVKAQKSGCFHTVFFDVASRDLLSATHGCYGVGGFGFRNYWFTPVKEAISGLKKSYKQWKKTTTRGAG